MESLTLGRWIDDFKYIFGCTRYPVISRSQLDFMTGKAQLDYEAGKVTLWTYRQLEKEFDKVQVES